MVAVSESDEKQIYGSLSCSAAKAVAVDMTYNMGKSTMSSFNQFIALMKEGKYADAAADGEGTAWCGQVKSRCSRDMD